MLTENEKVLLSYEIKINRVIKIALQLYSWKFVNSILYATIFTQWQKHEDMILKNTDEVHA